MPEKNKSITTRDRKKTKQQNNIYNSKTVRIKEAIKCKKMISITS